MHEVPHQARGRGCGVADEGRQADPEGPVPGVWHDGGPVRQGLCVRSSTLGTVLVAVLSVALAAGVALVGRGCARDAAERDCAGGGHVQEIHGGRGGFVCVRS